MQILKIYVLFFGINEVSYVSFLNDYDDLMEVIENNLNFITIMICYENILKIHCFMFYGP